MEKEVEITDLKKIIHDLMFFIVDAKKYVGEKKQDKYTLDYIDCFVNTMNLGKDKDLKDRTADIMVRIAKDLKKKTKKKV